MTSRKWTKCGYCHRRFPRPLHKQFCNRQCATTYKIDRAASGSYEQRRTMLTQRILECVDALARETRAWLRVEIMERMTAAQQQKDQLETRMRFAMERA